MQRMEEKRFRYLLLEGNKKPLEIIPAVRKEFLVLLGTDSKGNLKWKGVHKSEFEYPIFCDQEKIEAELVKKVQKLFPEENDRPILFVHFEGYEKWVNSRIVENKLEFEY